MSDRLKEMCKSLRLAYVADIYKTIPFEDEYGGRLLPLMPSFLPPFADKCTTLCDSFYHSSKNG
ncbi:hypothetical protein [Salibacterium lacus]|uniref:Uncharacterized protein n=1 Tax=Salibacterium lacus TaxID=1898109 RepID=A0ABW5T426_9BACI